MPLSYAYTPRSCHERMMLAPPDRAALDKLVLGVRLAPSIGVYDTVSGTSSVYLADRYRVVYRVVDEQVVVVHIGAVRRREVGPRVVYSGVVA